MASIEADREGSSNVLQVVNGNENNGTDINNDSFHSTQTGITASSATTDFSIDSSSSLLVPGKLFSSIVKLKECYINIIKEVDSNTTTSSSPEENPNIILMLNKDQMSAGIRKRGFKAETAKDHLIDLLDCVRPLCLPCYQSNPYQTRVSPETHASEISSLTERVESLCSQNKSEFEALQTQMESLKSTLTSFESLASNVNQPSQPASSSEPIPLNPDHVLPINHGILPVSSYTDNFIPTNECDELLTFLNTLTSYKKERGRSTIKFGEKYNYNGSREDSIVELPPPVKRLLDKLNDELVPDDVPLLNSCLVTKYSGPDSFIPEHSDNERAIHSDSSIFTVSVGCETTVKFRDVHSGHVIEQAVKPGSLYSMTRASQDLFKHSIVRNLSLAASDTRFSLTFRSVHWRNNNSTVIIGDSNTCGLKFSGFGSNTTSIMNGTFGNAMPGKQVAAFTVEQLDPFKCTGFNNIVVHCGINSIRRDDITTEDQVKEVYTDFKTKISDIVSVNSRARIYVSTLLPTKLENVNKKLKLFNSLIVDDLPKSFKDIRIINHHSRFSSVAGFLTPGLSREFNSHGEPDQLHLNESGLRLFSFIIKSALFSRKKSQERGAGGGSGGRVQQERSYSSVASRRGRHDGRRGGGTNRSERRS